MHVNNLYALVCKIYLAVCLKYFWYLILALLCVFLSKKLVSNYSLNILCVLEFATNKNTSKP